ncbi:MAG: lipid-binding SYLF domain-containing protein [Planctomycetia bacterium]|nr:lipid-binding SYLF domain-containing protein [Planctomycetia bacterium]
MKMKLFRCVFLGVFFATLFLTFAFQPAYGQLLRRVAGREETILTDSYRCMNEIMAIPAKSIPAALFEKAEGIAIFPGLVKGSFIVGAQHGSGVLIVKNAEGQWEAPRFLEMTGGSVGFQAGIQAADIILIFCTRRSVEAAMSDQFTIGADASVSAGPLGRQASASTNVQLSSEIYSYSRSRGLFLGVALDGCVLNLDEEATQRYYANGVTPSATNLVHLTAGYVQQQDGQGAELTTNTQEIGPDGKVIESATATSTGNMSISGNTQNAGTVTEVDMIPESVPGAGVGAEGNMVGNPAQQDREAARRLLVTAHESLMKILEPEWQRWLALPPDVLQPAVSGMEFTPSPALLTLQTRLQQLADDPKYATLAARPEFTQVKLLLALYLGS